MINKRVLVFLIFTFLGTIKALAIDHKAELKKAQDWADSFQKDYPILLLNRDEFHFLFLKNQATEKSKEGEVKRIQIISDYVKNKVGIELSYSEASNFETYLFTLTSSAVALPFFKNFGQNMKHKICVVFANAPNGNSRIEVERLTGIENNNAYIDKKFDQLILKEDFSTMYLFSLYHEVSHCLDQVFLPKVYQSYQPSPHDIHLSESFAETLAYLHLVQNLDSQIAKSRILYRNLYSRTMGEYFANNPSVVFGDENILAGGAVYYLSPVLLEAFTQIETRKIKPTELNQLELYEIAGNIVREKSIHFRTFTAIVRSFNDPEAVKQEYEILAFKSPELFLKVYEELIAYYASTDIWLNRAFDESIQDPVESQVESLMLPSKELCQTVKENNKDAFLNRLTEYRDNLNSIDISIKSRKEQYTNLNNLAFFLKTCL